MQSPIENTDFPHFWLSNYNRKVCWIMKAPFFYPFSSDESPASVGADPEANEFDDAEDSSLGEGKHMKRRL